MTTQRLLPTLQHHTTMIVAAVFFMVSAIMLMMLGYWGPAGIGLLLVLVSGVPRLVEKVAQATVPVSLQVQYAVLSLIGPYIGGALGLYRAWLPVGYYRAFLLRYSAHASHYLGAGCDTTPIPALAPALARGCHGNQR